MSGAEQSDEQVRLYDVPADVVMESVRCTYCGADIDKKCVEFNGFAISPHAQRWWDYWNATHPKASRIAVYTRRGVRA